MKFINRQSELGFLNGKWAEDVSQLVIIYGKRRVGKTELIKQFIKGKPAVYFMADKRTPIEQLRELGRLIGEHFKDETLINNGFPQWLDVFKYLKEKAKKPFVFAVDEYPYLVEVDQATSSLFQKGWDEILKESKVFLILSGSSVSMMESEALLYKSPLYGRRSGQILLKPLSFKQSSEFFPHKSFEEILAIYTVTGGLPAYILQIDPNISIQDNIKAKIFPKTQFLHSEVDFILKEELRETKNYLSILKAISWGKRKFGEIINDTGLQKNIITKYLHILDRLQLIEKEVPVTEDNLHKSRKGLYQISDNFVKFWFQYIFPYMSDLEIERYSEVQKKLAESFIILQASVYENVCRELVWDFQTGLFQFERVGKWWEKNKEIDLVALNNSTGEILFGECKWSSKPVGVNIYEDLVKKAASVQWQRGKRKERYILFSKSGFTKDMIKLAKEQDILLVEKNILLAK
ncbi:MAG: ATP-binding protein [bacterium]